MEGFQSQFSWREPRLSGSREDKRPRALCGRLRQHVITAPNDVLNVGEKLPADEKPLRGRMRESLGGVTQMVPDPVFTSISTRELRRTSNNICKNRRPEKIAVRQYVSRMSPGVA